MICMASQSVYIDAILGLSTGYILLQPYGEQKDTLTQVSDRFVAPSQSLLKKNLTKPQI